MKRDVKPEGQAVNVASRQCREVQWNMNSEILKIEKFSMLYMYHDPGKTRRCLRAMFEGNVW